MHPIPFLLLSDQRQKRLVHIPDTGYTPILLVQLPSELNRTTSKIYPPLKPFLEII